MSLMNYPNTDGMEKLQPCEANVPTYHFGVHKTIGIHIIGWCLGYILSKGIA